jgi:hypothetical protein
VWDNLSFLQELAKQDPVLVVKHICESSDPFKYKQIVLELLEQDPPTILRGVPSLFWEDREFTEKAKKWPGWVFVFAPPKAAIRSDVQCVQFCEKVNEQLAAIQAQKDLSPQEKLVQKGAIFLPLALRSASEDHEALFMLLQTNLHWGMAQLRVGYSALSNQAFMQRIMELDYREALFSVQQPLASNGQFMLEIAKKAAAQGQLRWMLLHTSQELASNEDFMLELLKIDYRAAFCFADKAFWSKPRFSQAAIACDLKLAKMYGAFDRSWGDEQCTAVAINADCRNAGKWLPKLKFEQEFWITTAKDHFHWVMREYKEGMPEDLKDEIFYEALIAINCPEFARAVLKNSDGESLRRRIKQIVQLDKTGWMRRHLPQKILQDSAFMEELAAVIVKEDRSPDEYPDF